MQRMVLFYTIQAWECYTMLALLLVNVCVNLLNCFSLLSQPTKCAKLNLWECSIIIIQKYPVSRESLGTAVKYHWCSWTADNSCKNSWEASWNTLETSSSANQRLIVHAWSSKCSLGTAEISLISHQVIHQMHQILPKSLSITAFTSESPRISAY